MDKKKIWKRVFIGLAWTLSLGGLITLMSFIEYKKNGVICKDVKIYIPDNQYFIDKPEINRILEINGASTLVGRRMEGINLHELENKLKANPFIEFAKVYSDMDGVIRVEVSQRQPLVRVLNRFDQDFYIDQHGMKLPLSPNFTARVLAVNGYIDEVFSNKVDTLHTALAKDIFTTADYIHKDSLWNAQIAQIYVNENREMELIPRVGSQRILIGNADSLHTKFTNLLAFYKQALPQAGWDTYKMINVKYANQVIGVKNEGLKTDTTTANKANAAVATDTTKLLNDTSQTRY